MDSGLHRLLRERFQIVAEIGKTKGPDESIIRPAREAAVIENRLAAHEGPMPADILVHIWRVLIGGACVVQRPFTLHIAGALDTARFLYGPISAALHADAADAVAALAAKPSDLAIIDTATSSDWWSGRGKAHAIGRYHTSSGGVVVVLGGEGVAFGAGPIALVAQDGDAPREVDATVLGPDDDVIGRYHPFPLVIPVAE
ncbi:chorismate mutase [Acuticoccus sp. 2012]|uniref:chorismate mutase n=1 Tax=Acuticoccus mangrovi TaxID=2796142 RepID=A0A934IR98_9HYPH|nr:chorismate mutase [Acuticoccus mangrovi]